MKTTEYFRTWISMFTQVIRDFPNSRPYFPTSPCLMALADYLAKNYLTQDSKAEKKAKKRKRKDISGLTIADDDALGWDKNNTARDAEDGPLTGETRNTSSLLIVLIAL